MAARHLVGGTFLAALRHLLAVLAARYARCAAHAEPSVKTNVLMGTQSGGRRFGTVGQFYITLIRAVVPLCPNWSLCKMSRPLAAEPRPPSMREGHTHGGAQVRQPLKRSAEPLRRRVCVVGGCGGRGGSPAAPLVRRSAGAAPMPPPAVSVSPFVRSCLLSALPVRLLDRCLVRRSAAGAAAPPVRGV